MAAAAPPAATATTMEEDTEEGGWVEAEGEEVMVLVDLPEFAGADVFAGARRIEIRVRWCMEGRVWGVRLRDGWKGGRALTHFRTRSPAAAPWGNQCLSSARPPSPDESIITTTTTHLPTHRPARTWRGRAGSRWSCCWTGPAASRAASRRRWGRRWWWTRAAGARCLVAEKVGGVGLWGRPWGGLGVFLVLGLGLLGGRCIHIRTHT